MRSIVVLAVLAVLAAPAVADPDVVVVIDFTASGASIKPEATRMSPDEDAKLVARFPHPHAGGKTCDPNYPNTPAKERTGGQLLPTITTVVRGGEHAYLIDYCPTGNGVPRTRRLIAIDDKDHVTLDRELGGDIPADELLAAVDVDGDGAAELVLTSTDYRRERNVVTARLVSATAKKLDVLGTWTAVEACSPGHDEAIAHRVTFERRDKRFHDAVVSNHCYYPP